MYYLDEAKEVAKRPELWATIAPFINPATIIPAISIGAVCVTGFIVINKFKSENKKLSKKNDALENELNDYVYSADYEEYEEDDEPLEEPVTSAYQAVNSTVHATVAQPLNPTVNNGSNNNLSTAETTVKNMSDEDLKKEMIRQAMSELGKRSAAARAEKKNKDVL